ncbi:rhomboid family intramembrane serine protease [Thermaerobacillus caldiproteolyticus]|uniref:Membrane associated rhomboid family serine protease n=1 Tax=Thermaerobacillus caldiproteolyticus TaxID=247480 RepID=A0A7W0C0W5_9BACL|nr:rhomboid family intramembrane serine protease [Anoxybacillus caldiproteolyticus]MBA2876356.1 membrane associated rhomboid family serine protease [Anoxybacillus caldiproteolyticus]QPA31180.1 rhomboid family intramembrane serine protease [Anoxybacillus caldiproteolyticus]
MFTRTENVHTFLRLYPVVSILVSSHFLFWFMFFLNTPATDSILKTLIGFNAAVWKGEYWRLVSPLFLHLHFGHMIVNSISLLLFGPALEKMLGKWKFIIAYIGSGLFANIATLFLLPAMYSHLGASGAIFGLFGIYSYLIIFRNDVIDQQHAHIIIAVLCIGFFMTITTPNMNTVAHLFGFLGGAIIAPFVAFNLHLYRR